MEASREKYWWTGTSVYRLSARPGDLKLPDDPTPPPGSWMERPAHRVITMYNIKSSTSKCMVNSECSMIMYMALSMTYAVEVDYP